LPLGLAGRRLQEVIMSFLREVIAK
jgi:hypothetical protein